MKSKILSFTFCVVAFALSMFLMLKLIDPSGTRPATETGTVEVPTEGGPVTAPPVTTEAKPPVTEAPPATPAMKLSDANDAGKSAERLIERLAHDSDKEYISSMAELVTSLREASTYLSDVTVNLPASLYYTNLADLLESVVATPFNDMNVFSTRVSQLLTRLDSMFPAEAAANEAAREIAEGEERVYFPKFDTGVNGSFVLAMLSVYESQTTPTAQNVITVSVGGNIVLGDSISTSDTSGFSNMMKNVYNNDMKYPLFKLTPLFSTDSLSLLSLENPLTDSINLKDGIYSIKGSSDYVKILSNNGVDAVTLTTEHILDYGDEGVADTVAALENAGVAYAWSGKNICYIEHSAGKIAIITYNIMNATADFKSQPKTDIAAAKNAGAVFVIVAFNWGNTNDGESVDYSSSIAGIQARSARAAIDNGASLVVGTHPHIMQALEKYKGKTIVYSTGDLSYAGKLDTTKASTESYIMRQSFTIGADGSVTPAAISVYPVINNTSDNTYIPSLVFDGSATTIVKNLLSYSKSSANGVKETDISYIKITKGDLQ